MAATEAPTRSNHYRLRQCSIQQVLPRRFDYHFRHQLHTRTKAEIYELSERRAL